MNKYRVKCPGCGHYYVEKIFQGFSILLHPGYSVGDPKENLPTSQCVGSFDYVIFDSCKHCCPQSFAVCPECDSRPIGIPSKAPCRC